MPTFEKRVQSILQGISRLSTVRGPLEPGSWVDESLEELDDAVWSIVEALIDEGRIAS